ncbi:MAG: 4Fe-4S binding protein [Clostridia bacterium]|nr:4Fe-4S binding protein [Clostridia bacterium]
MKVIINKENCIGCGACIKYCPMEAIQILAKVAKINEKKCIKCKACVTACMLDAIEVK